MHAEHGAQTCICVQQAIAMKAVSLMITASLLLAGCEFPSSESPEEASIAIMQAVFEDHFEIDEHSSGTILPIYLGIESENPPDAILTAFRKRYPGIAFHPFRSSRSNEEKEVIDPVSGAPAQNIEFSAVKWLGDDEVQIEIGWYCFPMFSGANLYTLHRKGSKWVVKSRESIYLT